MKFLITGVSGFIGSSLALRLIEQGYKVTGIYSNSKKSSLNSKINLIRANLLEMNEDHISQILDVEAVIYCAGRAHIMNDTSEDSIGDYRKINRDAAIKFAELAAIKQVKRFIYVSTIKVNGESSNPKESFVSKIGNKPTDPYALSKYEAEIGLLNIAKRTNMEVVIIRPPLVYGPGVKANLKRLISLVRTNLPLPFGSIKNLRSHISLINLCSFIECCSIKEKTPRAGNEVFVISDGIDLSTPDLIKKISKNYGSNTLVFRFPLFLVKFIFKILRQEKITSRLIDNLQIDNTKAYKLTNWRPVISIDEQLSLMAKYDEKK